MGGGEGFTFRGGFKRSEYRANAVRSVQGPGKGGGSELPRDVPSSLSVCTENSKSRG